MTGTSRPCQRYSRGPAKLKDGFRIMFRLLYTASERVAKRAGFCKVQQAREQHMAEEEGENGLQRPDTLYHDGSGQTRTQLRQQQQGA
jgi:hypothetical protein